MVRCLLACLLARCDADEDEDEDGAVQCSRALVTYLPTNQPICTCQYTHTICFCRSLLALTCPAAPTFPFPFASATPLASSAPPCADRASLALPALPQTQDADADADAGSNQTRLRRIAGRSRGASRIIGLRSAVSRAEDAWRALGRGERVVCNGEGEREGESLSGWVDVWDGVSVSVSVSVSCRS
jgi:hypothetical protein